MADESATTLPYRIACLCYLYDKDGRLLLLHRLKAPNQGLYSPIGGKLRMDQGESPAACALREIEEEAGLTLEPDDIHLTGLISEAGYEGSGHWLMFLYEVTPPVEVPWTEIREGRLEWHAWDDIAELNVPESDRRVIYPLIQKYHGRFFHAHIDCHSGEMQWRLEHADGDRGE